MTSYELLGRSNKADKLIQALAHYSYASSLMVNAMEQKHWEAIARSAGVKPPSAETIELVKERIAAMERQKGEE